MNRLPRLVFSLALVAAPGLALAGDVERAQHVQISEEMRKLAQRNAWTAVEQKFAQLEALEAKGEKLTYNELKLGAEAARAVGNAGGCRARAVKAQAADPSKGEISEWLADIDATYGRARVVFDRGWQGDRALVPTDPPFAPDQRAAVGWAANEMAAGRNFDGLLPEGEYTVGGQKFTVKVGAPPADVKVVPTKAERRPLLAYVGPRAELGVAVTLPGSPSDDPNVAQPDAFGGAGARLGVGVEVGFNERVGLLAEVGYHNLFSDPPVDANASYAVSANGIHMGYGWLAAVYRADKVWLAAGPIWGAGGGKVTGLSQSCIDSASCKDATGAVQGQTGDAAYQAMSGEIYAGGGAASVSYAVADLGKKLRGAVTLEGGAQTDSMRLYPWVQAAFSIAPNGGKK
jgi:hypothetical protein